MIQVRVAHDGGRTHIEIRAGNSPGTLHTAGILDLDGFNAEALLNCFAWHPDIEIVEIP